MVQHVFIINPVSGKVNAVNAFTPRILQAAEKMEQQVIIRHTEYSGHAQEIAQEYSQTGQEVRLYAVGGDGTLNEVLAGAYPYPNAYVASIPCGSGNDFIRSFGEQQEFLDIEGTMEGTAVPIDLIKVNNRISAAICSTGLDAKVAYGIPKYRRIPLCGGTMAYDISIVENLFKPLGYPLHIEVDGKVFEDNYMIVTICNGMTYGGGYKAAPTADLQDGELEVILVKKISRLKIPGILGTYKAGAHVENGEVIEKLRPMMQYLRGRKINITPQMEKPIIINIDGECAPAPYLHAEIMPSAARYILPVKVAARFQGKIFQTV